MTTAMSKDEKKESMNGMSSMMANTFFSGITKESVTDSGSAMMDTIRRQREQLEADLMEADIAFSRAYHKEKYNEDTFKKSDIVQKIEEKLKLMKQLEKEFQNIHTPT